MDTKILIQVREQAAAIDNLNAELHASNEDSAELRRQLAAKQQENERLRGQSVKMERLEQELAQIKELIAGSQQTLRRELVNEWAVTVAPHMKTTNREVQELREQQVELKKSLKEMLADFEQLSQLVGANITKLFTEQVNAGWAVVHEKNAQAQAALKKLHALNDDKLKKQQDTVSMLLKETSDYNKHFVGLINSSVQLNQQNAQLVIKLDATVAKFDSLTSGTIKEVAERARQSIMETSTTAINEVRAARTKAVHILSGFENRLTAHPFLTTLMLAAGLSLVMLFTGLLAGKQMVIENANDITMKATQEMINRLEPAIRQLNEQAQGLNMKVEQAEMWDVLTERMTYYEKQAFIKQTQEQAKRNGRTLKVSEQPKR